MTRTRRTATAALVALPVVAAGVLGARAASASRDTDRIRITATIASFDFVDLNAPGVTPGDSFLQTDTLVVNGRNRGSDLLRCTASGGEEHPGICDGVLTLDDGAVTVAGRLPTFEPVDGATFVWAVTGGTGGYAGATGQVTVAETPTGYNATVQLTR
jgi:hypothetical protein